MKRIAILGSTGSIGTQTLDVVRANGDIEVVGIAAGRNIQALESQIREFSPKICGVWDEEKAKELDTYKQNEADFEQEKEKWYEDVVFSEDAPDISNYKEYYESIDAANAEVLYKQVVEQTLTDEQMDDYVKTYSSMKPKEAAVIFDTMTDNLQLVADILSNMDTQSRGDILGKMNSDTAAKVTEIMEPSE